MRTIIAGSGSHFPPTVIENAELERRFALTHPHVTAEWIERKTGIQTRRIARPGHPEDFNSRLAEVASRRALMDAGVSAKDVEMIIFATCTPDTIIPSTACWLQGALGADRAWAFDLNAACSGFIYGMAIADQAIRSHSASTILLVGAEVMSAFTDSANPQTAVVFGDGAGAIVLKASPDTTPSDRPHVRHVSVGARGNQANLFQIPAGGSRIPTPSTESPRMHTMHMNGPAIRQEAECSMASIARAALQATDLETSDIDWILPHQANLRIIEAVTAELGLPSSKVLTNLELYGNTAAATIPTLFDQSVALGTFSPGQRLLLVGFGAGLTFAAAVLEYQ